MRSAEVNATFNDRQLMNVIMRALTETLVQMSDQWLGRAVAAYRDQFAQGQNLSSRGEGEQRGWRLNTVKCMEGNPFHTIMRREASLAT